MRQFIVVSLLILHATGCATITRGTNEAFGIQTTPPGAKARLSSGLSCETPCSLKVKRRSDFVVTITKSGYETVNASVDGGGAAGMAGNVILGGLIGAGVDAGTGAMHSHKPNPLVVTLTPLDPERMSAKEEEIGEQEAQGESVGGVPAQ